MRIALVFASAGSSGTLSTYAASVAKGMEAMGHRVDVLNASDAEGTRLPGYEYVVVLSEAASFFGGKIPASVSKLLATASSLVGKKSAAFLRSSGPFSGKALSVLMRAMEKEGMCVNWSELVTSPAVAEAAAKRIGS